MNKKHPFISVAVICYNGEATLARTLESIFAQDYPKNRYEVIVVDDGSRDDTAKVAKQYPVRYTAHSSNRGRGAARNTGLALAKGDIYVGFDDDTIASPNLLSTIASAYSGPKIAGVASMPVAPDRPTGLVANYMAGSGSGRPPALTMNSKATPIKRFFAYLAEQISSDKTPSESIFPVRLIYGASATFSTKVLRAVGGWGEGLRAEEDTELCYRITKRFPDHSFYAVTAATVTHDDPKLSVGKLLKRAYSRGPLKLETYRKHDITPPIFPFPFLWLLLNALALATVPVLVPLILFLLPLFLYYWWPVKAVRNHHPVYFALPYVQMSEEIASMLGLARGFTASFSIGGSVRSTINQFKTDSLFRNAVYLIMSTAIMSVLGFGFWIFIAHLYTPENIGAASALIAITLLLSNLSFIGLDAGLLRFLPKSDNQSRDINATLIAVGALSSTAAFVYATLFPQSFANNLHIFSATTEGRLIFAMIMAVITLNTLTDSIFIANRRAEFHTIMYAIFGVVKLVLPLLLIPFASLGIFIAYVAAATASLIVTFMFMGRAAEYHLLNRPNWRFIFATRRYIRDNYASALFTNLPSQVLPSIIISQIGPAGAAYFSMAWTMANLIYIVPSAMANSLLAEGSHDATTHVRDLKRVIRSLAAILVPGILVAVLVAPYALSLFGHKYSTGGTTIFQILAVCAIPAALNSIGGAILNFRQRTTGVMASRVTVTVVTLALAWPAIRFGLTGVGLAMLGGYLAGNVVTLGFIISPAEKMKSKLTSALARPS